MKVTCRELISDFKLQIKKEQSKIYFEMYHFLWGI